MYTYICTHITYLPPTKITITFPRKTIESNFLCVCMCEYMHVEARSQCWVSSSISLWHFSDRVSLIELKLTYQARMTDQ